MIKKNRMWSKNNILMLFFSFIFLNALEAQKTKEKPQINWLTFNQLKDSMAIKPKKIFVDIYTDWCGPCKLMDKKTFTNKWVVRLLNESYYAVKLNADRTDTITYNQKQYGWKEVRDGKGASALALEIGMEAGALAFPTLVIINSNYSLLYRYPGFLSAQLLEEVLQQYK